MGLKTEEPDAQCPSSRRQSSQPPSKEMSFAEGDSDGGKKAFEEKGKTLSARSSENHAQRRESEPSLSEENSKEIKPEARNSTTRLEPEASSSGRNSRKRKISSKDSGHSTAGTSSLDERSAFSGKKPRISASVHSSEKPDTPSTPPRVRTRHRRPPRSRSPRDHTPPLRKCLVTSLRAKSEAIYHDLAQLWAQQARSPLTSEQLAQLAQLQEPLCAMLQTFYAMSAQAAYGFPAEPWLVPAARAEPGDSVRDGEAHSSS
ncbi:protein FRG2-like-1 [Otolemur garnettii]|uniref:protein FRG2-like-1 n=1 Tax=Otolemur garnettii TaxID=30611 RepID=UPI00027425C2|nr:protein FRG2-like-1 [Otolemur garnettii]